MLSRLGKENDTREYEKSKLFGYMDIKKIKFREKKLNAADRNFSPCNVCDVEGTLLEMNNQKLGIK